MEEFYSPFNKELVDVLQDSKFDWGYWIYRYGDDNRSRNIMPSLSFLDILFTKDRPIVIVCQQWIIINH